VLIAEHMFISRNMHDSTSSICSTTANSVHPLPATLLSVDMVGCPAGTDAYLHLNRLGDVQEPLP
jgi:hypothetical protein